MPSAEPNMHCPPPEWCFCWRRLLLSVFCFWSLISAAIAQEERVDVRPPKDDADLERWLLNMVAYHRFSAEEAASVTGRGVEQIRADLARFKIRPGEHEPRPADSPLTVLPYPGGRHPRIGFLDGAIAPQRETKISIFAPWDAASYVVVDVPEAIWSNLGLTYLAHTHIDTVWTKQGIKLEPREWTVNEDGSLESERTLPNGIRFGVKVFPRVDHVDMEMTLFNGTNELLSDLRVQNCVMLKGAKGFEQQTNDNKRFETPYVACRAKDEDRWVITAWEPCHRAWGNAPCPCLHSDPKFPDCPPGETRRLLGWLSFFEGKNLDAELKRIDSTHWSRSKEDDSK